MPARSGAAHCAVKVSWTAALPGEYSNQPSPSPSIKTEAPSGDQLKEWTAYESNSVRGNAEGSTIHNPPGEPPARVVANAIHPCSGLGGPVVKLMLWNRASWLPSTSSAPGPTDSW